jgi:hypothetical protein
MNNIYLELELSLDPAITDSAALKIHLEQKIGEWNKLINTSPKFKLRVTKAKEFIKNGLTNLPKQAIEARNEIFQKLREDISELKLSGDIDEKGFKHLKDNFKAYFTDNTIRQEIGGTQFVAPTCPPSFQCEKVVSFNDMQTILDDLKIVENGKYKDLYEFLKLSRSTDVKILYDQSKEESNRIVKIMQKTPEVDALNRLSGKALNFFKDDKSKKNYDKALDRLPFDKLCDEKFKLRAIKKEITWKIYQKSIQDTQKLGFSKEEAEWLVYEFYCVTKKCPPPKQESEPISTPPKPVFPNHAGQSNVLADTTNFLKKVIRQALKSGTQITNNATKNFQQIIQSIPKPPEPFNNNNKTETTFSPDVDAILNEFYTIRKRYQSNKQTALLVIYDALDSLIARQQIIQTAMLPEMIELRAEIAAKLGESEYKAGHLDFALRYYNAVLEHDPRNKTARQRQKMIDDTKKDKFLEIETLIARGNIIEVNKIIEELKFNFETDFETIDFLQKTEDRLKNFKLSKEQLQKLINEKKWQIIVRLLESQPDLDSFYQDVLQKSKRRLHQAEKAAIEIRKTIQHENFTLAKLQLNQLSSFISDYPEIKELRNEIELKEISFSEYEKKIKLSCEQKHWVQAENTVRNFLIEHPVTNLKLGSYVQQISVGVVRYENKLRLLLFSITGGVMFLICSYFLYQFYTGFDGGQKVGIILFWCFEFVALFAGFSFLLRILSVFTGKSKNSDRIRLSSIIPWSLFIVVIISSCSVLSTFRQDIITSTEKNLQEENKQLIDVPPLYYGLHFVFPFLVLTFAIGWFQTYLYLFFQCCFDKERRFPSFHLFWLCITIAFGFTIIELPQIQESLGSLAVFLNHHSVTLLFWIATCLLVWHDNKKDVDASFGLSDFFIDYLYRKLLLSKLRTHEFGKILLLDTDWYKNCEKLQQQRTAQTAVRQKISSPPPLSPQPQITSIPVPPISVPVQNPIPPTNRQGAQKVPVPPLQNPTKQKR